jgi:oligopeptide transport system ATP-binding protein
MQNELIRVENVKKYFPSKDGFKTQYVKAVDGVSFTINEGETLGLVGESGCGKSTIGRVILKLLEKTEGNIYFEGKDIYTLNNKEMIRLRRHMQIIFQDPFASLNPRLRVRRIIEEPLRFHNIRNKNIRRDMVDYALKTVGLDPDIADRFPHEFSGGQQQRIGIARALILHPQFIVCDEAVSALDVSVQAQVLNLLQELKKEFKLTYLFISHNLSVIKHVCDRIAVMYLGKIVEIADKEQIFNNPAHPYTRALISAIPIPDPEQKRHRILLEGDIPSPLNPPRGCRFNTRCYECAQGCDCDEPELVEIEKGHFVACHKFTEKVNEQPFKIVG